MSSLSNRFINFDAAPLGSLSSIFEEEPVSLETFISDNKFMGQDWTLSPIQARAVKHIERIYLPDLYPLMAEEFGGYWDDPSIRMTNLITLQWGKGSGKDHVCRIASLRVAYLLLCLKSPQNYFSMPMDDSIHLLNIAANSGQANQAFFAPMTRSVKKGWFKDKANPIRGSIEYDKNIIAISGHSDAEGQEGLNILLGVADEIDAFKAKDEMVGLGKKAREASTSAEGILKMLKGSASTRFPKNYKRVAISYPRYLGSTIQRLTAEADEDIKKYSDSIYFVSGPHATWEVNPRISGKEDYASDYRKDPEEAAAMYECKPSRATDAYFRNMSMFREAVTEAVQPISISYEEKKTVSSYTGEMLNQWKPKFSFLDSFQPKAGANYAMHGDLAIRGDRAGIAMSHVERWEERIDIVVLEDGSHSEVVTNVPIIKNDFTIAFESDLTIQPPREIQISWARELCFELQKRGFHIVRFTFDGFQSADTMQILETHGIESERVSLDRDDSVYKNLKDVAYGQRLHMPWDQLLFNELEALSRVDNGKVDHPPNGSKDMADAFAGSVLGAIVVGGEESEDSDVQIGETVDFMMGPDVSGGFGMEEIDFSYNQFGNLLGTPLGMRGFGNGFN